MIVKTPGSQMGSLAESAIQITDIGIVVVVIGHYSARTDIGMPVYDGGIRASQQHLNR